MTKKQPILPHWVARACKNKDPDIFFMDQDDRGETPNETASAICTKCGIIVSCLAWAMETNEKFGIWGNTTPYQRRQLKRPVARVFCPGCDSIQIYEESGSEICLACGLSWRI